MFSFKASIPDVPVGYDSGIAMIKNEFEDELSNLDASVSADRSRRDRSFESAKNSDGPDFGDQSFGDHFLLEGFSVDENKNESRVGESGAGAEVVDDADDSDDDDVEGDFCCFISQSVHLIQTDVVRQMARRGFFFLPLYAAAGI